MSPTSDPADSSLFDTVDAMLDLSLLIYPVAMLRGLRRDPLGAAQFGLQVPDIEPPLTAKEVQDLVTSGFLDRLIVRSRSVKDKSKPTQPTVADYWAFLNASLADSSDEVTDAMVELSALECLAARYETATPEDPPGRLLRFSDEFADRDVVYAITENAAARRITVVFRGSVTRQDWVEDVRVGLAELAWPEAAGAASVKVHRGFKAYLVDSGKHEEILAELLPVLERCRGYRLFVTGHSLGGALSTLFGAYTAMDPRLPASSRPVTVISFASPRVGGQAFFDAFAALEDAGRVRHLRVTNAGDIVPTQPSLLAVYHHVGLQLHLRRYGAVVLDRADPHDGPWAWWKRALRNSPWANPGDLLSYIRTHGMSEYATRLQKAWDAGAFRGMSFSGVFRKGGEALPQDPSTHR